MNRTTVAPFASLLLGLSLSAAVAAQSPDLAAKVAKFAEGAKANAAALRAYSWKQRVQVTLKGEAKPAKLYQMRYDADGKAQKTELTAEAPKTEPEKEDRGRDRGRRGGDLVKKQIVENKIEDAKEYAAALADLCKDYLAPSPDLLTAFFSKAKPAQMPDGTVQLVGQDVLTKGDKLVYEINADTQALKRVMFTAPLEGDPVDGTVEFGSVPNGGPNYAARVTVNAPAKKLTAKIENFEYVK
jgi:hypothetical protein